LAELLKALGNFSYSCVTDDEGEQELQDCWERANSLWDVLREMDKSRESRNSSEEEGWGNGHKGEKGASDV